MWVVKVGSELVLDVVVERLGFGGSMVSEWGEGGAVSEEDA